MLNIYNMVLEITRRCNMSCAHCLRGASQRLDMSYSTLWNAFKDVDHISTLTISGGEPSMKPDIINNIWSIIVNRGITLGGFYVVTNAKSTYRRNEFLKYLDRLYERCDEKEMCSLVVSEDQFHTELRTPKMKGFDLVKDDFDEYSWYDREYFHPGDRKGSIDFVLSEGRALETGVATSPAKLQKPWSVSRYDGEIRVEDDVVYISANGNVTSCCDMSYKRIDAEAQGNVNTDSLENIILSNCEWLDDELSGDPTPELEEKIRV